MLTFEQQVAFDRRIKLRDRQEVLHIQLNAAFEDYLRAPDRQKANKLTYLMGINNNLQFLLSSTHSTSRSSLSN